MCRAQKTAVPVSSWEQALFFVDAAPKQPFAGIVGSNVLPGNPITKYCLGHDEETEKIIDDGVVSTGTFQNGYSAEARPQEVIVKRKYLKRLLSIVIVLLGISLLSFFLMYFSPGDPVRAMFVTSGMVPSDEVLNRLREEMGLNRPVIIQYLSWLGNCLQGDFGTSYSQGEPVAALLAARVMPTVKLALLALLMMIVMAVPIGIAAALYQNRLLDYIMRGVSFVCISMPNFWLGLLLLYFVAMKLQWVPVVSPKMDLEKLLLPAFTLACAMAGKYSRQVRTAVLEELRQDYVSGARARGLSEGRILLCHVLPNATLPLITLLGLSLGSLLGGTAVVEIIFSYPALGSLAISAITAMDYPLIQGYVLWIALMYLVVNLLVDMSYNFLDPRLRGGASS